MAERRRDRNRTFFSALRFSFRTFETVKPDEVIPVDGVASQEKTGDMKSTTPRATCGGGESGAGATSIQHVEVRVEECQLGESCWRTGRPRERRER